MHKLTLDKMLFQNIQQNIISNICIGIFVVDQGQILFSSREPNEKLPFFLLLKLRLALG
jgi:hypothetical protein